MPKSPRVTAADAIKEFEKAGFEFDRQSGSHVILKKAGHRYLLSIPYHKGKVLGTGLIKSLIADAGLTEEEFISLL